jgi:hypothetical protein
MTYSCLASSSPEDAVSAWRVTIGDSGTGMGPGAELDIHLPALRRAAARAA